MSLERFTSFLSRGNGMILIYFGSFISHLFAQSRKRKGGKRGEGGHRRMKSSLNLLLDERLLHSGKIMIDVYNVSSLKFSGYVRSGVQQRAHASRLLSL